MTYEIIQQKAPGRDSVKVLGKTYETGTPNPTQDGQWRAKLRDRNEMLHYLKDGERYWFGKDWFGSEKRKNPA
jgi:hypothetical protein